MPDNIHNFEILPNQLDPVFIWLPIGIDEHIYELLPSNERKARHLEKYLYPIHIISRDRHTRGDFDQGGVRINMAILEKMVTRRRAHTIIRFLVHNCFIVCDQNYNAEEEVNRAYNLHEDWETIEKQPYEVTYIRKKLIQSNEQRFTEEVQTRYYENLTTLNYDYTEDYNLIPSIYNNYTIDNYTFTDSNNNLYTICPTKSKSGSEYYMADPDRAKEYIEQSIPRKIERAEHFLNMQQQGEWIYAPKYRNRRPKERIYSSITQIKRELRPLYYIPGLELWEADLANSQPFLLNTVLSLNSPDSQLYYELTQNGEFWNYMIEVCNVTGPKDIIKAPVFHAVIYSHPYSSLGGDPFLLHIREAFKNEFPVVYEQIVQQKTFNYKNLARQMQKHEAHVVLDTVANQLSKEDKFFLTIHDSIVTDKSDIEYAIHLMKKAFEENYSLSPKIEPKRL